MLSNWPITSFLMQGFDHSKNSDWAARWGMWGRGVGWGVHTDWTGIWFVSVRQLVHLHWICRYPLMGAIRSQAARMSTKNIYKYDYIFWLLSNPSVSVRELQMINLLSTLSGKWSKIIWYANSFTRLTWFRNSNLWIFNVRSDAFAGKIYTWNKIWGCAD